MFLDEDDKPVTTLGNKRKVKCICEYRKQSFQCKRCASDLQTTQTSMAGGKKCSRTDGAEKKNEDESLPQVFVFFEDIAALLDSSLRWEY